MPKIYTVVFQHTCPHTPWGQIEPNSGNLALTKIYGDQAGKPYNTDVLVVTVEGDGPEAAIMAARNDALGDAGTDVLVVFEGAPLMVHETRVFMWRGRRPAGS